MTKGRKNSTCRNHPPIPRTLQNFLPFPARPFENPSAMRRHAQNLWKKTRPWRRAAAALWLVVTLAMVALSFTSAPFWGIYELSRPGADYTFEPEVIVLMGGSGMPGKSALMRTYFTAEAAREYPDARVIIALPDDTTSADNHLDRMREELTMRGVQPDRISFEAEGVNSRAQALNIHARHGRADPRLLLVTDPEHVYRAVRSFEKVGFSRVGSQACFEHDLDASLDFSGKELGGRAPAPPAGGQLRYQFWNHLIYQILIIRECMAIGYYKLQGWI